MLRREFDQVSKNCRILAFKLKKTERRIEELDKEKIENDKKSKEVYKIYNNNNIYYHNLNCMFKVNRTITK